jgi:hypothetical protein
MAVHELLNRIRLTPGCTVDPPAGLPVVQEGHVLPNDLHEFYEECGGLCLFEHVTHGYRVCIVPPTQVKLANPVIFGNLAEQSDKHEISWTWYIIARDDNHEYVTIDLSQERLGRCYDSFFDRHAMHGDCPIIALSFTDLLTRLYANKGRSPYWQRSDFQILGDAYER